MRISELLSGIIPISLLMLISPVIDVNLLIPILIPFLIILYVIERDIKIAVLIISILLFTNIGLPKILVSTAIFIVMGSVFARRSPLLNIAIYSALTFTYIYYYLVISGHFSWSISYIAFLSIMTGLTSSLIESVNVRDKNLVLILSTSTLLVILNMYAIDIRLVDLMFAFTIAFILSILALKVRIADETGLLSATFIGTMILVFSDIRFFLIVLIFYVLGSAATRYKYSLKLERGVAERAGGARGFINVFSNSLPALFFIMNYGVFRDQLFVIAFISSIATALGDTMASEIGMTSDRAYLITSLKRVPVGTSGGISAIGEFSALVGCLIVSSVAFLFRLVDLNGLLVSFLCGFLGVHIDSFLGATAERRGYLNNAGVNIFATLLSGIIAIYLVRGLGNM